MKNRTLLFAFSSRVIPVIGLALALGCGSKDDKTASADGEKSPASSAPVAAVAEATAPPGTPAAPDAGAPPADAQIKKDIAGQAGGIISIDLDKAAGKKSWNSAQSQYFWEKFATIKRDPNLADAPGVKLIVTGYARYEMSAGRYNYREFIVAENSYEGMPKPTDAEALTIVKAHLRELLSQHEQNIVNADKMEISIAKGPEQKWEWDSPKAVSFVVHVKFDEAKGRTDIVTNEGTINAKIFRDDMKGPWLRAVALGTDLKETGVKKVTEAELKAMPQGTK